MENDVQNRTIILTFLFAFFVGCNAGPKPVKTAATLPKTSGLHECVHVLKDGTSVRFSIYVPPRYESETEPLPLAMALHYGGEVTPYYGKGIINSLVKGGLDKIDPVIVAPDCLGGGWTNQKNEDMVLELYDHIIENYKVDTNRTVITGFSMGGHGAWYIASRNQDRFKAAIPVAGHPNKSVKEWTMPVMAIHSHRDEVVSIDPVLDYVKKMQEVESPVELKEVQRLSHFQTANFREPMRETQTWLIEVWDKASSASAK